WEKEATFRLPAAVWRGLMDLYYPNSAWLCLRKDVFDRLSGDKSRRGCATWEQALERLPSAAAEHSPPPSPPAPGPRARGKDAPRHPNPSPPRGEGGRGGGAMTRPLVERIADAVLYEGYILYPYRPSVKNRQRWTFGGLYPEAYSRAQGGTDACSNQTECLIQ